MQDIIYCKKCNKRIKSNKTKLCKSCYTDSVSQKSLIPERNILKSKIRNQSFYSIAKEYNVARATIFRWCKKYSLPETKMEIDNINNEDWLKI